MPVFREYPEAESSKPAKPLAASQASKKEAPAQAALADMIAELKDEERQRLEDALAQIRSADKSKREGAGQSASKPERKSESAASCMICSGRHSSQQCPIVPPGFWENANKSAAAALRRRHASGEVLLLSRDEVRCVSVAGDGNCLFAAFCHAWKGVLSSPQSLRDQVVAFVQDHAAETFQGMSWAEWLELERGLSPEQYKEAMARPHGLDEGSWAGAFEASVLAVMFGCNINIFEEVEEGFERIMDVDLQHNDPAAVAPGSTTINLLWTGVHYDAVELGN